MNISPIQRQNPSFKSATVCVNVLSDTHGELFLANSAAEEMRKRRKDIFTYEKKGSANITAVCGDWFMDGAKKGYKSNPKMPLAKFQLEMLNGFFNQIKKMAINSTEIFTLGNHEFDGGVELLDDVLSGIDADVIASNLDIENSSGFSKSIENGKIFNEKIVEVEDDKNPDLKHKLLFLGVMPVNLKMYQKNLNGISLTDLNDKPQAFVSKSDYMATLDACKKRIARFKKENPNGIVIFLSHTGVDFSDNLARESETDIIFDGHEHKTETRIVNKTPIIPLSQNFQRISNAKIQINDEGKIDVIRLLNFNPSGNTKRGYLYRLYNKLLAKDIEKKYSVKSDNPSVNMLDVQGIRDGNNFLANFVTDSILDEIRKEDSSVDFFALNASAIRHSLPVSDKPSVSYFDIMNVLAGIKEEDGQIMITDVTGEQLVMFVIDNILFNKPNPQKNPIIHYSGLIIDREKIIKIIEAGKLYNSVSHSVADSSECSPFKDATFNTSRENLFRQYKEIAKYIINANTNTPIDLEGMYRIANVEKYFNKSQKAEIKELKSQSEYIGYSVQELFLRHFDNEAENLVSKCDIRII